MIDSAPATSVWNFIRAHFLFIAICTASVLCGSVLMWKQLAMLSWPRTQAKIAAFERGDDPDWDGHWYANPTVRFEYEVAGVRFEGTKLNPSWFNYQSPETLDRETGRFAAGALVDAWYNPSNAAEAYVVNVGVTLAPVMLLIAGIAPGILAGLSALRRRAR